MTDQPVRRSRLRRFFFVFAAAIVVIAIGLLIGLSFVPGGLSQLEFGYRVPPTLTPVVSTTPLQPSTATEASSPSADAAPVESARKELFLTYAIPTDLLQREVAAIFPITEGVEGMMKIVLSDPQFVRDADGTFLRLTVNLKAVMGGAAAEEYPGSAVVRTQLRFDPASSTVALRRAELAEFRFSGAAARVAESLRPIIESELASQMNGYVVFRAPQKADWWTKNGLSLVRDVVVENGQVVVVIGP
jgi:hypothetical protein